MSVFLAFWLGFGCAAGIIVGGSLFWLEKKDRLQKVIAAVHGE